MIKMKFCPKWNHFSPAYGNDFQKERNFDFYIRQTIWHSALFQDARCKFQHEWARFKYKYINKVARSIGAGPLKWNISAVPVATCSHKCSDLIGKKIKSKSRVKGTYTRNNNFGRRRKLLFFPPLELFLSFQLLKVSCIHLNAISPFISYSQTHKIMLLA